MEINNLNFNPFKKIGQEWMLITAKKDDKINSMTASWGGIGVIWNKNVVFVFIRPERYTYQFTEFSKTFSLTFFDSKYKDLLKYFGQVSGKTEDKIQKSKFTISFDNNTPYFAEAKYGVVLSNEIVNFDF